MSLSLAPATSRRRGDPPDRRTVPRLARRVSRARLDGRPGLAERARARPPRRACPVRAPAVELAVPGVWSTRTPAHARGRVRACAAARQLLLCGACGASLEGPPCGLCTSIHASPAARSYILCLHGVLIAWSLIASTLGPSWCAFALAALRGRCQLCASCSLRVRACLPSHLLHRRTRCQRATLLTLCCSGFGRTSSS